MKGISRRLVVLLLLAMAVAAGAIWWFSQPLSVDVATVSVGPAVEVVYATGVIEPRHPAAVAARVTAPVARVLVKDGDAVHAGQPLALLEDSQQRALLAQAQANRVKADRDAARIQMLFDQGWVTRAALDSAIGARDAARAAQASSRALLEQYIVRSAGNGIVLKRTVEPGDLATPATTLFTIGDPHDIWVTATVDERDVPRLVAGQEALMRSDAWPDRVIAGRLLEVTPGGDALQRAFRARILIDRPQDLPMGLSLEVNIVTARHDRALLVPEGVVSGDHVWTIRDGRAHQRPVKTGIAATDRIEIVSGLKAGETVILHPPEDLAEGARVTVLSSGRTKTQDKVQP